MIEAYRRACRAGCRDDDACPIEQLCEPAGLVCKPGCDGIENCGPGKLCKAGL